LPSRWEVFRLALPTGGSCNGSADGPRFIETLPRRGYRFIAPVISPEGKQSAGTGSAGTEFAGNEAHSAADLVEPEASLTRGLWIAVVSLLALASVAGAVVWY